jgi:hypothetical protein
LPSKKLRNKPKFSAGIPDSGFLNGAVFGAVFVFLFLSIKSALWEQQAFYYFACHPPKGAFHIFFICRIAHPVRLSGRNTLKKYRQTTGLNSLPD